MQLVLTPVLARHGEWWSGEGTVVPWLGRARAQDAQDTAVPYENDQSHHLDGTSVVYTYVQLLVLWWYRHKGKMSALWLAL